MLKGFQRLNPAEDARYPASLPHLNQSTYLIPTVCSCEAAVFSLPSIWHLLHCYALVNLHLHLQDVSMVGVHLRFKILSV